NFTAKQANSIGVKGFIRNASDGTASSHLIKVTGEAQGSDQALKEFVQHLNKGPPAANVTGVEHSKIDVKQGESRF
ncbi:hypothetical protein AOQ84DRAFT_249467, partial [Glonium stellatum]